MDNDTPQSHRRKTDEAWEYCRELPMTGKTKPIECLFCGKIYIGGGINRMKQHLAAKKGNVLKCLKVPDNVHLAMVGSLKKIDTEKKKSKDEMSWMESETDNEGGEEEEQHNQHVELGGPSKKKKINHIKSYTKAGAEMDLSQPSIQSAWQSKKNWHNTNMAVAKWFYSACLPTNAVNDPYFKPAMSQIASMGRGYTGPTYHELRVPLLQEAKREVSLTIKNMQTKWAETGCTIMADGWTDTSKRYLVNFLVYCHDGLSFIKSVDASHIQSSSKNLCNLFSDIVEIVGVENVVHVVTDNANNYKGAGKMLNEKYPTIFWSPCAAHCINLIMKDIGEMVIVKQIADFASQITTFVYNHKWTRGYLRRRSNWTEIITPAATRFGTTFIALQNLYAHRAHLEAMVVQQEFKKILRKGKNVKANNVREYILSSSFWNTCLVIVKVMEPLIRLLRICDADEKPSLGYVYEGIWRAIRGIKETFKNVEKNYKPFVDIINARWDKHLKKGLHDAAHYLNPAFQYDLENPMKNNNEAYIATIKLLQKLYPDSHEIMEELAMFRDAKKSFGMNFAVQRRTKSRPDEWWRSFGHDAPLLKKFAERLLSQTSSSSGCERNWSVFERIHTKKNRLEHERLQDLIFVHYNLRLLHRDKKWNYDPLDYECIDKVNFWVVEREPDGELDYDELMEEFGEGNDDRNAQPSKGSMISESQLNPMNGDDEEYDPLNF